MSERRPELTFPCTFPIKVIGNNGEDFAELVAGIVRKHVPAFAASDIVSNPSGKGTYVALTATFTAESREQLDALYRELGAHDRVLMVL